MMAFGLLATLLVALSLLFVLPGLLRSAAPVSGDPAGHAADPSDTPRALRTAWAVAAVLPALSVGLYLALGQPQAALVSPGEATVAAAASVDAGAPTAPPLAGGNETGAAGAAGANGGVGPAQIQAMVQRLADRLATQPNDVEGWRKLVRSYETLGRFQDAVRGYQQLVKLVPDDADLLTEYAVTLAMSKGQTLTGEPEALIQRALAIRPDHLQALALSGSAAYERQDFAGAVDAWKKILTQVPPEDPIAASIQASIDKAEAEARTRPAQRRPAAAAP